MRQEPHHYTTYQLVTRIIGDYLVHHRLKIFLAVLCMVLVAAATAANAYMLQPVLDDIFIRKDRTMLMWIPLAVLAIAFVNAAANYGQTLFMRYVGQRIIADMQIDLFSHLMKNDISFFHEQSSGRLISRFTNDIQMMRNAVSSTLTTFAKETLTMIFLVAVMVYRSPELSFVALFAFPLAIYPILRLSKRMRKISNSTQVKIGDFTAHLDEVFQGVRTVKAYGREHFEVERARQSINGLFRLYIKNARVQAAGAPMMEMVSGLAIASVIAYGGMQVVEGHTTAGAFFSFIAAFLMAYRPVKSMAGMNSAFQEGLASANRFFTLLDQPPSVSDAPQAQALTITKGDVVYEDVTFHYGENTGGVEHVDLWIPAGSRVALVGLSGGGKSTLMNLLLRFYDVHSGRILIDGQDIRGVTLGSLREAMAFVPQETILFDDTVRANIGYGKLGASEEEIIQAASDAAADEFIRKLPQGYDTMIGPNGVRLSGGQRQRIAIARAMLKNAPLLLLDEATSSLDTASERLVQEALLRLMKNRTTLVIAHRLSTVMDCDRIYVIEHGKVVESGTHASLLAAEGTYHKLYAQYLS